MRKTLMTVLCFGGLLVAGSVSAQLAGTCLDVTEMGPWYPVESTLGHEDLRVPPPAEDYYMMAFPVRIRFGDEATAAGERGRLEIPAESQQTPHSWRSWWLSGDTLQIHLSSGFGGVRAKLRSEGEAWAGTLRTFSDNLGTLLYERTLVLSPARCDSPPPVSADEDPPLPRTVELATGEMLELGRTLPEGIATEERASAALTVVAEPAGRFAGADTVIVQLGRTTGRIESVELRYTEGFDLGPIVASMVEDFGPFDEGMGWSWHNRTTRLWVAPPDGRPRVRLVDPRFSWER